MKLTTEEILNRFNRQHNYFYKYNIQNYNSINDKTEIVCPLHGKFFQSIANHFKHGCYECAKIRLADIKRGDLNVYLDKCKIIHNNKFDYSKIIFNKLKDKVEIICQIHGSFFCSLDSHMNKGTGCKKCSSMISNRNKNYIFLPPKNSIYDYSKAIYINSRTHIEIICPIVDHGSFFQTPNNHLTKNHGCPKCAFLFKAHDLMNTLEHYLDELNTIHNNKYDYSKFQYMSYNEKSIIICPKHGEFLQSIGVHLQCGCPICNMSRGERDVMRYLIENGIKFEYNYRFADCINKRTLPFDFYLPEYNICIEFDGEHHYGVKKSYSYDFLEVQKHDRTKTNYCIEKKIRLIRIPYFNGNKIKNILDLEIKKHA